MTCLHSLDPNAVPIQNKRGKMRTPVWFYGGVYRVCVGNQKYRFFNTENVPEVIKVLITMIRAFPPEVRRTVSQNSLDHYIAPDPRLEDIGWETGPYGFMLILDPGTLHELWPRLPSGKSKIA